MYTRYIYLYTYIHMSIILKIANPLSSWKDIKKSKRQKDCAVFIVDKIDWSITIQWRAWLGFRTVLPKMVEPLVSFFWVQKSVLWERAAVENSVLCNSPGNELCSWFIWFIPFLWLERVITDNPVVTEEVRRSQGSHHLFKKSQLKQLQCLGSSCFDVQITLSYYGGKEAWFTKCNLSIHTLDECIQTLILMPLSQGCSHEIGKSSLQKTKSFPPLNSDSTFCYSKE